MPRNQPSRRVAWKYRGRSIGFIRDGTYYITRSIAGRRVRISTGCVTEDAARGEYERFEMNPGTFVTRLGRKAIRTQLDEVRAAQLRANHLARRYAITRAEYERRLMEQGGRCAICGTMATDAKRGALEVDHCHTTGAVRGLLCGPCNRGIGNLGDSAKLLQAALEYLTRHEADAHFTAPAAAAKP